MIRELQTAASSGAQEMSAVKVYLNWIFTTLISSDVELSNRWDFTQGWGMEARSQRQLCLQGFVLWVSLQEKGPTERPLG